MVTEHGQFLGGGRKVMSSAQQLSQPLYTIHKRGGRFILSKKTSQLKFLRVQKRQKSGFSINWKILDCEPTNAIGDLKKESNVRI
jgi:hypothetical protein